MSWKTVSAGQGFKGEQGRRSPYWSHGDQCTCRLQTADIEVACLEACGASCLMDAAHHLWCL